MARPWFDHFRFVAPIYDRLSYAAQADPSPLLAALDLPTPGLLLDAGGGTGRASAPLAAHTGGVIIVDASRGMLRRVRKGAGLHPVLGLAEALPFPDGSVARILIVDAFHHFYHHTEAVAELWRVLQPGGRLVIQEVNIARWQVKLIALGETLLLMRSRFFTAEALAALFAGQENARVATDTESNRFQITLVAEKRA